MPFQRAPTSFRQLAEFRGTSLALLLYSSAFGETEMAKASLNLIY